jgi:3-hydroxymyristoyl/3-hydroxydecanoyl-(acyl carrier protein) dehydratase
MKFLRPVRPDDPIVLSARKTAVVGALWQFEVAARVRGETVAEGVVVLGEAGIK